MGRTKGAYNAEFPVGTRVRIVDAEQLAEFLRDWKYHHPLQSDQVKYGGQVTQVTNVMFYHGGDELYELLNVPGLWHEICLSADQPEPT